MGTVSVYATTSSSITAIGYLNDSYESTKIEWYLDGALYNSSSLDGTYSQHSIVFSGLLASTTYTLKFIQYYYVPGLGTFTETGSTTATTDSSSSGGGGGGGTTTPDEWIINSILTLTNLTDTITRTVILDAGEVARIKLSFAEAGDVSFEADSSYYYVYFGLSSSTSFDYEMGWANSEIAYDRGSPANFTVSCDSGTTYYLFVRHAYMDESGSITVTIVPPQEVVTGWSLTDDTFGTISESGASVSTYISEYQIIVYSMKFSEAGTATFYTTGSTDTTGYLTTTLFWDSDTGVPDYPIEEDDQSGSGNNFKITCDVEADTTYYLWVRGWSASISGSATVCVDFEPSSSGGDAVGTAAIEHVSSTASSLTVKVTGLDTNYSGSDRTIVWYYGTSTSNYTQSDNIDLSAYASESSEYTITGLRPSTNYYVYAVITYNGGTKALDTKYLPTNSWHTYYYGSLGTISDTKYQTMRFDEGEVGYVSVTFSYSGTATFYTSGYTDTIGTISTSTSFNSSTGWPSYQLVSPVDGGVGDGYSNFSFTYNVTAGTTYYVWARYYYGNTSCSTTLYIEPPTQSKPTTFSWTYAKTQGGTFNLTAAEWNALQAKVNEVREYHGLSAYSLTNVTKGSTFNASDYNQVLMAIAGAWSSLGTSGVYNENEVYSGGSITASCLNKLVTLTNDLIDA